MDEILMTEEFSKVLKDIPWQSIIEIAVNIFVLIILSKIIDKIVVRTTENLLKTDKVQLAKIIPFLARILKVVIFFLAIAAFFQSHGYSVNSFLAGFGITGLAVGFAAKEAISDIFGSISVVADKVFRVGDYVCIGSEEGTVEDINFRSTRLRKLDDTIIAIPNRSVASSMITNYSLIRNRMIDEIFGVVYSTSNQKLEEAIEIIKNIAMNDENVLDNFQVFVHTLNSSSIDIRFIAYLRTGSIVEARKMKSAIILKIVEKYREAGIDFAFPSTSVYMEN